MQAHLPHQPLHGAAGNIKALAFELPPHLADTIDLEVRLEDTADLGLQGQIPLRPCGKLLRVYPLGNMVMIGGRGDQQNLADRLDPIGSTSGILPTRKPISAGGSKNGKPGYRDSVPGGDEKRGVVGALGGV